MAQGVYEAAKMIYGDLNQVAYICLEEGLGIERFTEMLSEKIEKASGAEEIIVLADLMGGSPYNTCVSLLAEKALLDQSKVISGLSLPLLLVVLLEQSKLEGHTLEQVLQSARMGIDFFQLAEESDDEL